MPEKKYVFQYDTDLSHYTASAFCLRCFDDRFWKSFKNFTKSLGVKHIDPESVAGGAKILASPEHDKDRDFMLRELEKSIRLHHTKKVMLFSHHDCAAYGGFTKFSNDEQAEFDFHAGELAKAKEIVLSKFPGLEVEAYFIDQKGVIKV